MYNIINYFLKTSEPKIPDPPKAPTNKIEQSQQRLPVKNCNLPITNTSVRQGTKNKRTNTVYLVIEKNTQNPLGIFDNFERAKESGQKTSHYNCVIIPFQINDPCKYLFNPVFENK
jgi:hypothetical protein